MRSQQLPHLTPNAGDNRHANRKTMTMTTLNTTTIHGHTEGRFDGIRRDLRTRFEAWKVFRQTRRELNELSDRELADLGLHRSGITAVAREAAYGN
ncbi:hypothetical protein PAA8504_01717 [Palleronia abyssalis]|uniref:YjiS-like domain-containing protein n=2 Tax=Palleronia abyssalis TaxID=1501240 RepID=A0A2R8BUS0_9RHOB|nr:hypothetical protein PAA8504_01717 [Palleronia abyssalis]